jgi:hypothetical protein
MLQQGAQAVPRLQMDAIVGLVPIECLVVHGTAPSLVTHRL